MQKQTQQSVDKASTPFCSLMVASAHDHRVRIKNVLQTYVKEKKMHCVYLSFNRPYAVLSRLLPESGVPQEDVFFVDAISRLGQANPEASKHCIFIDTPRNLTGIALALVEALHHFPKNTFVFLDSIDTLLVYHAPATVEKFVHFLITRTRAAQASCLLMASKGEDPGVLRHVEQFVDEVIEDV